MKILPGSKFSQLHRKLSYTRATTQHTGSEHRFSTLPFRDLPIWEKSFPTCTSVFSHQYLRLTGLWAEVNERRSDNAAGKRSSTMTNQNDADTTSYLFSSFID